MMKPDEQMKAMLEWLIATSHDGLSAKFDMGIGDAGKDLYFRRNGLIDLSIDEINNRTKFFRAVNANGVEQARRPLNIYICSAKSQLQSWLMLDDLTIEECRQIASERTAMIIQTSATSHHLWLATSRPVSVAERKLCQQVLQKKYGGDEGSVSGDHLGRLAGFKSAKRNCWVNHIGSEITGRNADVDKLLAMAVELGVVSLSPMGGGYLSQPKAVCTSLALDEAKPVASSFPAQTKAYQSSDRDESHAEFAFACAHYAKNLDIEKGILSLAQRAMDRGKRKSWNSAEAYARKTFNSAEKRNSHQLYKGIDMKIYE